jgi:hypothetical protein
MRFRTKVFTLLLVVAVRTAALMAAFVPGGCRGFPGAGPLCFGGYPQMKSVTRVSLLYSHRKEGPRPLLPTSVDLQPSQQLSPEETVTMLNEFFEQMIEAVFKNFGHLNRFMGAGLMAPFGALRGDEFQEEHAVQAALEMRTAAGRAIVGNIGSKQRTEFTSIGESINLASRHEGATRDRAVDILVSGYSDVAAPSRFPFEPIGEISIKGKAESARTYMIRTVS